MAKYDAEYSCGHTETVQLFGPEKDRQRKLEWYRKSGSCPACHKAEIAAKRAAEAETAAHQAADAGLPDIIDGTDKQIAWAQRIRAAALASPDNQVAAAHTSVRIYLSSAASKIPNHGITPDVAKLRVAAIRDAGNAARARLETQASAAWWIDHRDTIDDMVRQAMMAMTRVEFAELFPAS